MKYLVKKFLRDFKKLWSQFFSVFMMAAATITVFTGMSCVWVNTEKNADKYFEETNLADAFINGSNFTLSDSDALESIEGVDFAGLSMKFQASAELDGVSTDIVFNTVSEENLSVLKPLVMEGDAIDYNKSAIWLSKSYAKEHNLKPGQSLCIEAGSQNVNVEIAGLIMSPEYIYYIPSASENLPNYNIHGYAYIPEAYAKELQSDINYNQIRIRFASNYSPSKDDFEKLVRKEIGDKVYSISFRDDIASIQRVSDDVIQTRNMALLFSVVFLLLSLLTMYTTISRLVNNQITQIGTLKALGFSNCAISIHYIMYGLAVTVLGGILGNILGITVIARLVYNVKMTLMDLPECSYSLTAVTLILWASICIVCAMASYFASRKIIRGTPALTIRGIHNTKESGDKPLKRSKLSYNLLWTVRSIKNHPIRFAITVIAVFGSLTLLVAGIGIQDTLKESYASIYTSQYTYSYAATIKQGCAVLAKKELQNTNSQFVQTDQITIYGSVKNYNGNLTVFSEGDFINLFEQNTGEKINVCNSGACITRKAAEAAGIKENDICYYKTSNSMDKKQIRIEHIVDAKIPQGLFIPEKNYTDFIPNSVYMDEAAYEDAQNMPYLFGFSSIEDLDSNTDDMMRNVRTIAYILIFAAFLLCAVILYNLGTLNFVERYREYATMKVLGFYRKELRKIILADCILTLITGLAIGIPFSRFFLKIYIQFVSMDSMEWIPVITNLHFILAIFAIVFFALMINLIITRKIKKVDMVEAMKAME